MDKTESVKGSCYSGTHILLGRLETVPCHWCVPLSSTQHLSSLIDLYSLVCWHSIRMPRHTMYESDGDLNGLQAWGVCRRMSQPLLPSPWQWIVKFDTSYFSFLFCLFDRLPLFCFANRGVSTCKARLICSVKKQENLTCSCNVHFLADNFYLFF